MMAWRTCPIAGAWSARAAARCFFFRDMDSRAGIGMTLLARELRRCWKSRRRRVRYKRRRQASDGRAGCPGAAGAPEGPAAAGGRPPGGQRWRRNALRRRWRLGLDVDGRMFLGHVRGKPFVPALAPGALARVDRLADFGQLALEGGAAALGALELRALLMQGVPVVSGVVARLGELLLDGLFVMPLVAKWTEDADPAASGFQLQAVWNCVNDAAGGTGRDDELAGVGQRRHRVRRRSRAEK